MKNTVFLAVLVASLFLVTSCASRPSRSIPKQSVQFVTDGLSPKWKEIAQEIIPKRINSKARAFVVSSEIINEPVYFITFSFVNKEKEITGSSGSSKGTAGASAAFYPTVVGVSRSKSKTSVQTKTTIEVEATMRDNKGAVVWEWSGYGEDEDEKKAMKIIGDKIGAALAKRARNGFHDVSVNE